MHESDDQPPPAGEGPKARVFMSYARQDLGKARQLIAVLERAGFDVWWDGLLEAGSVFTRSTEEALETADAVVVLWSKVSVESNWVRDEATSGRQRGRLVPVTFDASLPPLGFRQFQSIDLSHWKGDPAAPGIHNIVHAIQRLADPEHPPPVQHQPPRHPLDRRLVGGVAIVLLLLAAIVALSMWDRRGGEDYASLAILPFDSLAEEGNQDYFADGLSEELRALLSKGEGLRVTAQTSSSRFRGELGDPKSISDALGVDWLLDGSVRRSGETVRVSAQLIDGRTGFDTWSETYEREMSDIFAVQSDIAQRVASALAVRLGNDGDSRGIRAGGTANPAAFDAYLRGVALYELAIDEESDRSAKAQFEAAIAADPGYGSAWAALSRVQTTIANSYASDRPLAEAYAEAIRSAQKAVDLAPRLAQAHAALGYVLFNGNLDAKAAEGPYRESYRLGAGNADILQGYATFMARTGRFDEARAAIDRALVLDPLNPSTYRTRGLILYAEGEFDDARNALQKALELNPQMSGIHKTFGQMSYLRGDYRRARAEFMRESGELSRLVGLAITLPRLGDAAGGEKALADLRARYGRNSYYQQAEVLAQTGRNEAALAALERAHAAGDSGLVQAMNDPLLAPLQDEPRFVRLLRSMGFSPS